MHFLSGNEEKEARDYLNAAAEIAKSATCNRHKCGSVIVNNGIIIGKGMNSPPANKEDQRRCSTQKESYDKRVTDKTCCMHAEQRAIMQIPLCLHLTTSCCILYSMVFPILLFCLLLPVL